MLLLVGHSEAGQEHRGGKVATMAKRYARHDLRMLFAGFVA